MPRGIYWSLERLSDVLPAWQLLEHANDAVAFINATQMWQMKNVFPQKEDFFFPTSVLKWSKSVRGEINYTFSGKQWIFLGFRLIVCILYLFSENTFIKLLKVQITQKWKFCHYLPTPYLSFQTNKTFFLKHKWRNFEHWTGCLFLCNWNDWDFKKDTKA